MDKLNSQIQAKEAEGIVMASLLNSYFPTFEVCMGITQLVSLTDDERDILSLAVQQGYLHEVHAGLQPDGNMLCLTAKGFMFIDSFRVLAKRHKLVSNYSTKLAVESVEALSEEDAKEFLKQFMQAYAPNLPKPYPMTYYVIMVGTKYMRALGFLTSYESLAKTFINEATARTFVSKYTDNFDVVQKQS